MSPIASFSQSKDTVDIESRSWIIADCEPWKCAPSGYRIQRLQPFFTFLRRFSKWRPFRLRSPSIPYQIFDMPRRESALCCSVATLV